MPEDNNNNEEIQRLQTEVKRLRQRLSDLTSPLDVLLRHRGFRIYRKEPSDDLVLPPEKFLGSFYEILKKYSFRLFLRDVIKHQDFFVKEQVERYATADVTGNYIDFLLSIMLIEPVQSKGFRLIKRPVKSFGATLEWLLCEIFKREFASEATWGVKFKRPKVGGDYDLISKIDGLILYMEIKSSPPKQIYANEIAAFLDRVSDLSPDIAVFFMDTELRMKDKIVPMFEDELKRRYPDRENLLPFVRIEKELFQILERIFIINAKDSIRNNIERVLIRYFRPDKSIL
ncbi:MAG: hypothetical protein HY755_13270 [Nitrospirae bacterium]|nr:hypothetical protein [Nitrospirota bacterium]